MKTILIHPAYFPSIAQMTAVAKADKVVFEVADNYQKQTYRNRTYIAHTNGRLLLNVPVKHAKDGKRQATKNIHVENDFPWQSQHWKSLETAYRTSPFFEFYEDDLVPFFKNPVSSLLSHNLQIFELLCDLIGIDTPVSNTLEYLKNPPQEDFRYLIDAKKEPTYPFQPYTQVLEAHHGFLPNLSVLDLLFNEGPNTISYLEAQSLAI